jgi:hypothetical protein
MATPKKVPLIRKLLYYGGMIVIIVGLLSFIHASVDYIARLLNFIPLVRAERTEGGQIILAMLQMLLGAFLMQMGARGWARRDVASEDEQKSGPNKK